MTTMLPLVTCPTCSAPVQGATGPGPACTTCGLPAAGNAGLVVARIEATLHEFRADRDRLLESLRSCLPAPPAAPVTPATPARPYWVETAGAPPRHAAAPPPTALVPPGHLAPPPTRAADARPAPPARPRRRLRPQEVLLGTGVLLVVSAAIAFVAVAWDRLGVAVQAASLLTVTAALCVASVHAARRRLGTTANALAIGGLALVLVDVAGARAKGLFGLDTVALRWSGVLALSAVVLIGAGLGRVSRATPAWPVGAILAAQPILFLLLPRAAWGTVAVPAVLLAAAVLDLWVARRARDLVAQVAVALAGPAWLAGVLISGWLAWTASSAESILASAVVIAAGAILVAGLGAELTGLGRRLGRSLATTRMEWAVLASALAGGSVAGTAHHGGALVEWTLAALCLLLIGPALALGPRLAARRSTPVLAAVAGAAVAAGAATLSLLLARQWTELGVLAVLISGLAAAIAFARPALRVSAATTTVLAAAAAITMFVAADLISATQAGYLLTVLAAATLGIAATRVGRPEERPLAGGAAAVGGLGALLTISDWSLGSLAAQLTISGSAALAYGIAVRLPAARYWGLTQLLFACWVVAWNFSVDAVEAYTLPAAVVLLAAAGRGLRTAPSWSVWGAPLLLALLPSALLTAESDDPVRLVLVVTGAVACAVVGTVTHRQAPFAIGTGVLVLLAITELGPYAAYLPRWVPLGLAGLVLLGMGATYERRLRQAREAIGWVAALR